MIEKTKGQHAVKFLYTADLIGREEITKMLGSDYSFFNRASIISVEFTAEHEANVQLNAVLQKYETGIKEKVVVKKYLKNTLYYQADGVDQLDWEELVIRKVSLKCLDTNDAIASGRLHIVPQMESFEISKLNPTPLH